MRAKGLLLVALSACASAPVSRGVDGPPKPPPRDAREATRKLAALEETVLDRFASADTRLAARTGVVPSDAAIAELEKSALFAEDTDAILRGRSLDPFSFAARARALDAARASVSASKDPLPEVAPSGSALDRPALERELLLRAIDEERARVAVERALVPEASALVRAVQAGWADRAAAEGRDAWLTRRLGELRDAARKDPSTLPADLDDALSPLERAMVGDDDPRATSVLSDLRALAAPARAKVSSHTTPESLAALLVAHLGVDATVPSLSARLAAVEVTLRARVDATLAEARSDDARETLREDAAKLLLVGSPCPVVGGSRIRSVRPPPEREPLCGALVALDGAWGSPRQVLVEMAIHDAAVLALAGLPGGRLDPGALFSRSEAGRADRLARLVASDPVLPIGVALAGELLFRDPARTRAALDRWLALGDAPLDVVARELR